MHISFSDNLAANYEILFSCKIPKSPNFHYCHIKFNIPIGTYLLFILRSSDMSVTHENHFFLLKVNELLKDMKKIKYVADIFAV